MHETATDAAPSRPALGTLAGFMAIWGYTDSVNMAAAPFIASEFGLDDSGIAWVFGLMAIGALGSLPLARAADRLGRRRVLLACLLALAPAGLATAFAPTLPLVVAAQVVTTVFKGVLLALIPVMVAESLGTERRARGQSVIGICATLGSGMALVVVSLCEDIPGTWRWSWGVAALLVGLGLLTRGRLGESRHFEGARQRGETVRSHWKELLTTRYRRRALGVIVAAASYSIAIAGTQSWLIYYPVTHLGIEPLVATAIVIAGGSVSLLGFPIGGRLADAWGRRATFCTAGLLYVLAAVGFYSVTPGFPLGPEVGLALTFGPMSLLSAAAVVPMRAATTELFPTRLRGAVSGTVLVASAAAWIAANVMVALLAGALGGIAPAAIITGGVLGLGAIAFAVLVPETSGLELEHASLEG